MSDQQADPLRLVVQHMEEQLDDRVDAVSDAKPAHEETTKELIHLEETLSSAQDKAKKLVTLRLKLEDEEAATDRAEAAASARAGAAPAASQRNDAAPAVSPPDDEPAAPAALP